MYWLIGSLITVAMMGVLAVADNTALPTHSFLLDINNSFSLALIIFAIILIVIAQFKIPSVHINNTAQNPSSHCPRSAKPSFRIIYYLSFSILAIGLIIGSAVQALVSHQHAEAAAISEPMRVQALVTIEGVSDSVYDASTESGYRQVATISHITPLVSKLTAQDLDNSKVNYLEDDKNSLSSIDLNNQNSDTKKLNTATLTHNNNQNVKYRILLNAYPKHSSKSASQTPSGNSEFTNLNYLQPGDQLFMSLTLAPLESSEQAINNPSGFDSYRWLRGRHIDGVANILATSASTIPNTESLDLTASSDSYFQRFRTYIDQGRWQLRQHFHKGWEEKTTAQQQAKAVTLSLLTGDRSLINRDTKDLYQLAGISHLLAISGTHVLFLAIMLSGTVVSFFDRLWPVFYRHIPRWQVRWWVMIGAAFIYALFTGFDVPAARTAWMLLAIGLVRLTLLPVGTMRVLFALAILMAWLDPYVLWQAGYWLSFIAVALLLKYDDSSYRYRQSSLPHKNNSDKASVINTVSQHLWIISRRVFKLQFWLFLTLLPVTLLLFGKASLWGLVINLFAIGLFGWVIVPLNLLAGLCYLLSPTIADSIWQLVSALVAGLHKLMTWLTSLPALSEAWLYTPVNIAILFMALLSILPWLLPRGFVNRWLALPPLTLLMMTVYANQQSLAATPTLYILPTGDRYISAALLQYPVNNKATIKSHDNPSSATNTNKENVSWLLLTDHRDSSTRTMPSRLTAAQFSIMLEQQLGSLSVDRLQGIIVQSSSAGLTDTLAGNDNQNHDSNFKLKNSELLPMTVAQLNQRLPISQYWQAGRSDRWPALQRAYKVASSSTSKADISVQRCEQGKRWQLTNGELSIQALTGWSKVGDASVWDCTVVIDSRLPLRVLTYNAADPLKSLPVSGQTLTSNSQLPVQQTDAAKSRIILNADTHQRLWQMWELLCSVQPYNTSKSGSVLEQATTFNNVTWLGHSTSHITADVLNRQKVNQTITYDDKGLEAAWSFNATVDAVDIEP